MCDYCSLHTENTQDIPREALCMCEVVVGLYHKAGGNHEVMVAAKYLCKTFDEVMWHPMRPHCAQAMLYHRNVTKSMTDIAIHLSGDL